jgi:transposase
MPQREPLRPIDANRGIKKELRPTQRSQISAYKSVGLTNEQIGARIFCAPTTISYTLKQIAQRDDFKSLPRSGRPSALTRQDRRTILRIVRSNPKITYAVLKLEAGVKVHKSTLY